MNDRMIPIAEKNVVAGNYGANNSTPGDVRCYRAERQLISVYPNPGSIIVFNDSNIFDYLKKCGYTTTDIRQSKNNEVMILHRLYYSNLWLLNYTETCLLEHGLLMVSSGMKFEMLDKKITEKRFEYLTQTGEFFYYVRSY